MHVFPYVKFYFFPVYLLFILLLPPLSLLLPLLLTLRSPKEVKYRQKNDENPFCLLLFLGGKLCKGAPSFSQHVYAVYLNKYNKAYLDSFDFFTSEAYYLIYVTANYTLQIKSQRE